MTDRYTFMGQITLEAGSWADWFSGIAATAAVLVALFGYTLGNWQRAAEARERNKQSAKLIGMKLFRVMNGIHTIHQHLFKAYDGPPLGGEGADELWRRIQPLIGLERDRGISLDGAEITFLIDAKAADFLSETMLAIDRYNGLVSSMQEYKIRYEAVYSLMPPPHAGQGIVFQHALTPEQYWRIRPYVVTLENLIQALRGMAEDDKAKCQELLAQYTPLMKAHFGEKKWLSFSVADPVAEAQEAVAGEAAPGG